MRRVFAYLIKQRFIDREVLSHFAHEKLIYEDKEYHNAVFVGLDENGTARHAHKRGTYTQGEAYKGNVEGSNPNYSFHYNGAGDTLYVFEAPVDLLSFITLHQNDWKDQKDWKQHSYVTLDGISEHALLQQIKQNPHLKNIVLCLDHDEAGIEATGRLKDILTGKDYYNPTDMKISVLQSQYKDWNEDLKARHGLAPIPALLPQMCEELLTCCEELQEVKDPDAMLREYHRVLEPLLFSSKAAENTELAKEYLQGMAAGSLLAMQRQCSQMERPVTIEQLMERLQTEYRPHLDRGWLRTKSEELRQDIKDLDRQVHAPGIRTLEDREKLLSSYQRLALDCVKTQLFMELEVPSPCPVEEQRPSNFIMTM